MPKISQAVGDRVGTRSCYPVQKSLWYKHHCEFMAGGSVKFELRCRGSLAAQMVKNPPAMWEMWLPSLGWEDPLEEGMATHSGFLAWRIPWTEGLGGLQSMRLQRVGNDN